MSELQAEGGAPESVDAEAQETEQPTEQPEVSDSAPETEEEKVTFDERQQAVFNEAIGQKTYKIREAERRAQELERELEETRSKLPKETRPEVPKPPDPFDDDYEVKLKEWADATNKQAAYDAQQQLLQQQEQQKLQAKKQQEELQAFERVKNYTERAKAMSITPEELQKAAAPLQGAISPDVEAYILEDEQGPLITKYLGANPLEVDKLSTMTPMQAGAYMLQVKEKAAQLVKKKVTQAPEPVDHISGGGAAPERGPAGATFE